MKTALWTLFAALVLVGGLFAYGLARGSRPDCPGKITCPLTGEDVCKDQCPLVDPDRADCPGKIVCPLTGELVCRDRCPLEAEQDKTGARPSCCRETK